ncbi:MAG TPA: ERF family protein [Candidatus Paceibacterota bacterium]
MSLAEKLNLIAADCAYIQKGSTNEFHKYRYVSAEDLLLKVTASRIKHGVAIMQTRVDAQVIPGAEGSAPTTLVNFTLVVSDTENPEDHASFCAVGSGQDKGDKGAMKAMTAAHKYAWIMALGIATGDDPEADTSTDKAAAEPKKPAKAKKEATPEALAAAIDKATDVATLEGLKAGIIALRGQEGYDDLRTKYKARESSLLAGAA